MGRKSAAEIPALSALSAKTEALTVSGRIAEAEGADPDVPPGPPPWRYTDIDCELKVASRDSRSELTGGLHDAHGPLVEVTAELGRLRIEMS